MKLKDLFALRIGFSSALEEDLDYAWNEYNKRLAEYHERELKKIDINRYKKTPNRRINRNL